MNWTETIVSICTGIITLTQFLLWRYIARNKSYESEKGKNLATKEDVAEITKKIESVKESYSKALENHKIELQKKFEIDKYTIDLCKKYDSELIGLLQNHIYNTNTNGCKIYDGFNYDDAANSLSKLSDFLCDFNHRYGDHPDVKCIIDLDRDYKNITRKPENETEEAEQNDQDPQVIEIEIINIFKKSRNSASKILNHFLPKLDFSTIDQES